MAHNLIMMYFLALLFLMGIQEKKINVYAELAYPMMTSKGENFILTDSSYY